MQAVRKSVSQTVARRLYWAMPRLLTRRGLTSALYREPAIIRLYYLRFGENGKRYQLH